MRKILAGIAVAVVGVFALAGTAFAWSTAATVSGVQSSACGTNIVVTWTVAGTTNDTGFGSAVLSTTGDVPTSTSPSPLGSTLIESGKTQHSTDTVTTTYPAADAGATVGLKATVHGWYSDAALKHSVDDGTYVYSGTLKLVAPTACPPPPTYSVTVTKTGTAGALLAGATFTLDGQTATTNASGVAAFTALPAGVYTLHETVAPTGYELSADQSVTVPGTTNTCTTGIVEDVALQAYNVCLTVTDTAIPPVTPPTTVPPVVTPPTTPPVVTPPAPTPPVVPPAIGAPAGSRFVPAPVVGATTVHTGEPWAGSKPYELLVLFLGLSLVGLGIYGRRHPRHRRVHS